MSVEKMQQVLRDFREWHANHFGDFDDETNAQLLCLDNDAAVAQEDEA